MILQFIDGCAETCRSRLKKGPRPLVVRLAETARDEIAGVRSAEECLHEGGQPE